MGTGVPLLPWGKKQQPQTISRSERFIGDLASYRASLEVQWSPTHRARPGEKNGCLKTTWILLLPFGLSNSSSHMRKQQNPLKLGIKKRFVVSIGDTSSKTRLHFPAYVGSPTRYRYHPVSTVSCWRVRGSHLSLGGPTPSAKQHILQNQGTTVVNPAMSLTRTVDTSEIQLTSWDRQETS